MVCVSYTVSNFLYIPIWNIKICTFNNKNNKKFYGSCTATYKRERWEHKSMTYWAESKLSFGKLSNGYNYSSYTHYLTLHCSFCSPWMDKAIETWTIAPTSIITFSSSILPLFAYTVLSRVNTHGRSQLKRQKLRVGGYTEKVLNYLRARAHLGCGCKVSCQGVPHRRFVCASSRPTRQWRKLYHTTKLTDS